MLKSSDTDGDGDVKLDSYLIGDHIIQTTSRRRRN